MSYTPGPWAVDVRVGCIAVYQGEPAGGCIENGRRMLAYFDGKRVLEPDGSFGHWETNPQDEADAHLIAAAPDLLEACKIALYGGGTIAEATERIRSAIAKAEGRHA